MTSEEFSNSKSLHEWWMTVSRDPRFEHVVEEAMRRRRFTETFDSPLEHIEYKALAYKEGSRDLVRILRELCDPTLNADIAFSEDDLVPAAFDPSPELPDYTDNILAPTRNE